MARVTVEDCLARIPNRFALTILASRRARALGEGRGHPLVECENKEGVTALREIGRDYVRYKQDVEEATRDFIEEQRRQLRVTTGEHTFLEAASLRALEDEEVEEEEADEDVEELQSDPEALGKQAKSSTEGEDEEEESTEAQSTDEEESEDFDESEDSGFEDDIPDSGDSPPDLEEDDTTESTDDDDDDA